MLVIGIMVGLLAAFACVFIGNCIRDLSEQSRREERDEAVRKARAQGAMGALDVRTRPEPQKSAPNVPPPNPAPLSPANYVRFRFCTGCDARIDVERPTQCKCGGMYI